jgi:hypothetical protein
MNKKQFQKAKAEFNRFKKYVSALVNRIQEEEKYYNDEIKQKDYNDDDIWAIIKGCFNNTELSVLDLHFKYLCEFYDYPYWHYYDFKRTFNEILIAYMRCDVRISWFSGSDLDYDVYKKWYHSEYKNRYQNDSKFFQFTNFCNALNEFKQSHQSILNLEPIDVYNYDDCDVETDDEPDEPDEPDELDESDESDESLIDKSSIVNDSICSLK